MVCYRPRRLDSSPAGFLAPDGALALFRVGFHCKIQSNLRDEMIPAKMFLPFRVGA